MSEHRVDDRIRAWLTAREPGTLPEELRAAAARVPYDTPRAPRSILGEAMAQWRRPLGTQRLVALGLLLALLAGVLWAAALALAPRPSGPQSGLFAFAYMEPPEGVSPVVPGPNSEIYVIGAGGSGLRRLTSTADRGEGLPAFSPDGTRLAFVRVATDRVSLVVMEVASGTELVEVLLDVTGSMHWYPIWWSPSGTSVLVSTGTAGVGLPVDVTIVYPDAGVRRPATASRRVATDANIVVHGWSPDEAWLLVESTSETRPGLFAVPAEQLRRSGMREGHLLNEPADLEGARRLTRRATAFGSIWGWALYPTWAPDSSAVVYSVGEVYSVGDSPDAPRIELATLDGETRVLVEGGFAPAWSPDGDSIAYLRAPRSGAVAEVWLTSASGGEGTQVAASLQAPAWSPDGERLQLVDPGGWFSVRIDGSDRIDLTPIEVRQDTTWVQDERVYLPAGLFVVDWQVVQP